MTPEQFNPTDGDEVDRAWERHCREHLQPSILFRIALGLDVPDTDQQRHLMACARCRTAFDRYRSAGPSDGDEDDRARAEHVRWLAAFDRGEVMTPAEREREIRDAVRLA